MSVLLHESGTEDLTNDTIPFSGITMAKVGMDLFEWKKLTYLTIVDYHSRFIQIAKLDETTAEAVIQHSKNIFSRYVIPKKVVTCDGSLFDLNAYQRFSQENQFHHIGRSPFI